MRLNRPNMKRARAFRLELVMTESRSFSDVDLGHCVGEVEISSDIDVALDDRRLRVTLSEYQIAHMHGCAFSCRIRDEEQMNRLVHDHVSIDPDHCSIVRERSVEIAEGRRLSRNELAEMALDQ